MVQILPNAFYKFWQIVTLCFISYNGSSFPFDVLLYVTQFISLSYSILKCFEMENISSNHHLQLLSLRPSAQLDSDARSFWSYIIIWKITGWIYFSCISVHLTCSMSSGLGKKIEPTDGYSSSFPVNWALLEIPLTHCAGGIAVSINISQGLMWYVIF